MQNTVIGYIKSFIGGFAYNIGFVFYNGRGLLEQKDLKINWLKTKDKTGWYADPFLYSVSDCRIEVFVEEFVYATNKGRIVYLDIDRRTREVVNKIVMLELDTHLSFPIFRSHNGKIYVYPENSECGCLNVYELDPITKRLINPTVLIAEPLTDAVSFVIENNYYITATKLCDASDDGKVVFVYKSDDFLGPYREIQIVRNEKPIGRGAGNIINLDGQLIRPSQNCEGRYGKEVIFNEMNVTNETVNFKEFHRLSPNSFTYLLGLHTYNRMGDVVVVDGMKYRKGFIPTIIRIILDLTHAIK